MDLFDFIKTSFTDEYKKINNYEKSKHFFMYNRFFSIKYPKAANFLNKMEVPMGPAVDNIVRFLKSIGHTSTPTFFYTKAKSGKKENTWYPKDKEMFKLYLNMNKYSIKVFNDALKMDPKGTKKDYEEFVKEIS